MKSRKFLKKYAMAMVIFITIIATALSALFIFLDSSRSIDDQINNLYEKDKLVQQSFANAYELNGVTCYINESDVVVVFESADCSLKTIYNKQGEVLTKEFEDSRLGTNLGAAIALLVSIAFVTAGWSFILLGALDIALSKLEKEKQAKTEAKSQTQEQDE